MMKLGEKIMYARKKAGMSQIDLADELGVSRQSVSKWETNESNPDISKLAAIARVLHVSTDWLLSEDDAIPDEMEAEEKTENRFTEQRHYPEWVDHLPGFAVGMVKKYGWLYGVYTAVVGIIFMGFGFFVRFMTHNFIFGSSSLSDSFGSMSGSYDSITQIHQKAWSAFSAISGFTIAIGAAITLFGIILAAALKIWGRKTNRN